MMKPPIAHKKPHTYHVHDITLVDNYHWLRDEKWPNIENEQVLNYLNQENAYYHSIMDPHIADEDALYKEMVARMKLTDSSVPIRRGPYFYYSRTEEKSNYPIFCRKQDSVLDPEVVILDVNHLAEKSKYFNLGAISVSPNHQLLAYSSDTTGGERFSISVKALDTGELLNESVEHSIGQIVWHKNNQGFFYAKTDENWRTEEIYFHVIGNTQSADCCIYKEIDPLFRVSVSHSMSKRFIFINSESKENNEIWFIDSLEDTLKPTLLLARRDKHLYEVEHHENNFYIQTNDKGKNFRLVRTSISDFSYENWQEVIGHSYDSYLCEMALYQSHYVILAKENGLAKIRIYPYNVTQAYLIDFPDPTYTANIQYTSYEDTSVRIAYSSLINPSSILAYDFKNHQASTLKTMEIPSYQSDHYKTERIFATASDGALIPISLVYRKDTFKGDGKNPLYLYGYGSYGHAIPASFSSANISLLDRGFVCAIAHIRGGDDLGYDWYEAAKLLTKKLSFEDFISCSLHLIDQKYSSTGNIVIAGGSAGGLLMGYVINARPELFKAVVAHVPFVDVLNTMLDESLPLTPGEFKEWGNPQEKNYFDYIQSYCPYTNIKKQPYPHMYVTAGLHDPRVTYWEPSKWVAKLRDYKTDNHLLVYKINMEAGHGGASGRFGRLRETAAEYNFILTIFNNNHS